MAEILTIAWLYTIYKAERNQKHEFNRKMKQLEEVKRKRIEERIQLGIIHRNLHDNFTDIFKNSNELDEIIEKQFRMSKMWCRDD